MKPYTETQKQLQSIQEIGEATNGLNWLDEKQVLNAFQSLFNKGTHYVEAELLPVILDQHNRIEKLEKENKDLKDKILSLTGNE